MNRTRPVSLPVFFQACGTLRGMKAQVPGPPTVTSSPILKVNSPASTQATSSLSRCRWKRLAAPPGRVSSNIMMLSSVSRPRSFNAKERSGVGESKCFPPPAGTTKPFVAVMLLSSCGGIRQEWNLLHRLERARAEMRALDDPVEPSRSAGQCEVVGEMLCRLPGRVLAADDKARLGQAASLAPA